MVEVKGGGKLTERGGPGDREPGAEERIRAGAREHQLVDAAMNSMTSRGEQENDYSTTSMS
jgi:hypothetical protein